MWHIVEVTPTRPTVPKVGGTSPLGVGERSGWAVRQKGAVGDNRMVLGAVKIYVINTKFTVQVCSLYMS